MAALNDPSSSLFKQPKLRSAPRRMYGRQGDRPLSLTAYQFRRDTYNIPTDDDDEDQSQCLSTTSSERTGAGAPAAKEAQRHEVIRKTRNVTRKAESTARRLPANELFLVSSAMRYDAEPQSDFAGIEQQDPINDKSSSPRKKRSSSSSSEQIRSLPLSILRKRLKPPQPTIKAPRGPWKGAPGTDASLLSEERGRGGFEDSELAVKKGRAGVKKQRQGKTCLIPGFGALQLQCGPLPDVKFEPPPTELRLETHCEHRGDDDNVLLDSEAPILRFGTPERRVSSRTQAREDLVRKELASISAPARVPSEDGESGEESDEEEADDQGEEDGECDAEVASAEDGDSALRYETSSAPERPPSARTRNERSPALSRLEQPRRPDQGITLDFRPPMIPGQLPNQSLGRQNLVEVNEAIVEVPESEFLPANYILDCVERTSETQTPRRIQPEQTVGRCPRPILKNNTSTAAIPDSTTRAEHTQANTQRNGAVGRSESRYFGNAANALSTAAGKDRNSMGRRHSSFIDLLEVEVLGSENVVPETSPSRMR